MTQRVAGTDPERVRERLAVALEADAVSIEGEITVASPSSDREAGELLRIAKEERWRVLPAGMQSWPGPFRSPDEPASPLEERTPELVISSESMRTVVDHEPGDLVVSVQAGARLGELQSALASEGQWLALDPPGGEDVTLGGIVSTGLGGPLRAQYGRPRDHVLGLTLVDGRGRVLRMGGRVVKNVAGFDLVRLATGSCGSLGLVTEITFRLHPKPEADRTLVWHRNSLVEAWGLGRRLVALPLPVAAAELLWGDWPVPLEAGEVSVVIRLTGSDEAVHRMVEVLERDGGRADLDATGEPSVAIALAISAALGKNQEAFRLHALPASGREHLADLERIPAERVALHLLSGTFRGGLAQPAEVSSSQGLVAIAERVGSRQGSLTVTPGLRGEGRGPLPPGPSQPEARLRSDILKGFDPGGILPGAWRDGWLRPDSAGS